MLQRAFEQMRMLHIGFLVTWFLFIFVIARGIQPSPGTSGGAPFLPVLLGFVCVAEVGVVLFFRAKFISGAEVILRAGPDNATAIAKWRTGNLLSFCMAETVALFGLVLRFLAFGWNVAGVFFAGGLVLLLLWTPRKIDMMPRGVR